MNKDNFKSIEVGYVLSGVSTAFYYGINTDSVFLPISYAILFFIGNIILFRSTWMSCSKNLRIRILISNIIYLVLINILGILSKTYGGLIAFILIIITVLLYDKLLKKYNFI